MKNAATIRKLQLISDELKEIMDEMSAPGPVVKVTQADIHENEAIQRQVIAWAKAEGALSNLARAVNPVLPVEARSDTTEGYSYPIAHYQKGTKE